MPPSYYEVLEACAGPGCPLCSLSEKWVNRYLRSVLYEKVNDLGIREALRRAHGYCNEHAWRLPQVSDGPALGTALLYRSVLRQVSAELNSARFAPPANGLLNKARGALQATGAAAANETGPLQPQQPCPACKHREAMTASALSGLAEALAADDGRMLAALRKSAGLCLPHLRQALAAAQNRAAFEALVSLANERMDSLAQELDEFIRKNDHRFMPEGFGPEGDSWLRAIGWAAGAKGVQ